MYIRRRLSRVLKKSLEQFPALMITGPRQAGKTTFLLHEIGKSADYVSFDDPLERQFAVTDPNGFLDRFKDRLAILDEVQYVPEIFQYLKIRIDSERRRNGKWVLTGSQQFQLMKNITESLAGRIAILELLPFGLLEHKSKGTIESFIWSGGYPEPSLYPEKRDLWIRSYIQTYIERDVRQLQNIKDVRAFESFIGLTAAHHGQMFNTALLSRDIGVSLPTVKAWAGVLEASYLCYLLKPYFGNFGKRIVKTPKFYFLDTALVCAITRQPDGKSALSGAMGGALFEGMIVSEAVKAFTMNGIKPDIYFWRSHDGLEVDLIIRIGNKLYPVEIKLTSTPTQKHLEPLNKFKTIAGRESAEMGILVCNIQKTASLPLNNLAMPWHQFTEWLYSKLKS
ncbi:MAG: ATP-binding protein [Nitrospirae bacterium]|nr:ATP-binding protein [Nitrospirota bacterium]